jgi:FkbM family methyltransferase
MDQLQGDSGLRLGTINDHALSLRLSPEDEIDTTLAVDMTLAGAALSAVQSAVGFVQVGAFDGVKNDALHPLIRRFGWQGVLIEPQPKPFEQLRKSYAGVEGLVFLRCAVDREPGTRTLWRVDGAHESDPPWWQQIASFDREHVRGSLGDQADRAVGDPVDVITLEQAIEKSPAPVEVVQIDAEGYDAEIVACLDLDRHRPAIIRFEHTYLERATRAHVADRLVHYGYRLVSDASDTLAMQPLAL